MLKKSITIFVLIFIVIFIINIVYYYSNKGNVAVIKIDGIITNSDASRWIKEIKAVQSDSGYKAILIEINSPGGSANASEKLYLAIKKADKTKPVIAMIEALGASGAYYAACGARKIVAYPTSVVGSIGVLFETLNISGLAGKIGISSFVVKSGKVKDVGNPFRKPTEADKAMLQRVVNGIYKQFLDDVAQSRHIKPKVLKQYANGSVFAAEDALKIGLIDAVGSMEKTKNILKKESGIKSIRFTFIRKNKSIVGSLIGERFSFFLDYIKFKLTPSVKAIFYD